MENPQPAVPLGSRHWGRTLLALTLVVAAASVVWTVRSSRALSHTFDEPHHLATGLEWLQFGSYQWWTENPPLPKVVSALFPYAAGLRLPDKATWDPLGPAYRSPWRVGLDLLYSDLRPGGYEGVLARARIGTVLFLVGTLLLTFVLAGGRAHPPRAFVATALVATYPPLLGHAGFATTDVASVATVLLVLLTLERWLGQPMPGWGRPVALGAAFALAVLSKLTAPLFCLAAGAGWVVAFRLRHGRFFAAPLPLRRRAAEIVLIALSAFLVAWAGYRFSVGRIVDLPALGYARTPVLPPPADRSAVVTWLAHLPLPMPELWHGYLFLNTHHDFGHTAYLFGQVRDHGFWSFYLVGLLLKSPLPFLLLAAIAVVVMARFARGKRGEPATISATGTGAALAVLAVLALSTVNSINIGLRHLLLVVPLAALAIAESVELLLNRLWRRRAIGLGALVAVAFLLGSQAISAGRAAPELMAYFNPLAGREPGRALIDSDLDWGQDLLLLRQAVKERQITSLHLAFFGTANPCNADMPTILPLVVRQPATGWIALSEMFFRTRDFIGLRRRPCDPSSMYGFHEAPADAFDWLKSHEPVARIGASVRLYHIDPQPDARHLTGSP